MSAKSRANGLAAAGSLGTSYDVRIWKIRTYEGKRGTTYSVRWVVAGEEKHETYTKRALADSRRADLLKAARKGIAFDVATGLPVTELQQHNDVSWYEHACDYVDMKWDHAAGKSRDSIADAIATVTPALLATERGRPDAKTLRAALYHWACNKSRRKAGEPPEHLRDTVRWLERHTLPVSALARPEVSRAALEALARKLDGSRAAGNTYARKRSVIHGVLTYAVEKGYLESNPMPSVNWTAPKTAATVNPRVVVNHQQANALLAAVGRQEPMGHHLAALFGCMYFSGLRPAEAKQLHGSDLAIPEEGWGTLYLRHSSPATTRAWTDSGDRHEGRQLKHRAPGEERPVPCPPPLTRLLREHIDTHGTTSNGRLFRGAWGGSPNDAMYVVWDKARKAALTPAEYTSPLAKRVYDLRHACLSTWLNAGVPATQVAEWAGHSVEVLLRVYAKCLVGQDEMARRRIDEALRPPEEG